MPPSLLSLSQELRDLIYLEVLNDELPPPQDEEDLEDRQTPMDFTITEKICRISCDFPVRITAPPLLLVNRQIHAEVGHLISMATINNRMRYKLDCVMMCEEEMHLTWLSVPVRSSSVGVLEVDIRLYGDSDGWHSAWQEGAGSGCLMVKSLYSLLGRFLKCGPEFYRPRPGGVEVELLVLNVITPSSLHLGFLLPGEASLKVGEEPDTYVQ